MGKIKDELDVLGMLLQNHCVESVEDYVVVRLDDVIEFTKARDRRMMTRIMDVLTDTDKLDGIARLDAIHICKEYM